MKHSRLNKSKDKPDANLMLSRITEENWLLPDHKSHIPSGVGQKDWIRHFLEPRLHETMVPHKIIQAFEVARGALVYTWFFYPLATLGIEQCARVGEMAVRERCLAAALTPADFSKDIATLRAAGLISAEDEIRWHAVRILRNSSFHPDMPAFTDPGEALKLMHIVAGLINDLFKNQ